MKIFRLSTLGDLLNENLLLIHALPQPIGAAYVRLVRGHPLAGTDGAERMTVSTKRGPFDDPCGSELADLIGNTNGLVMASKKLTEILRLANVSGTMEIFPFGLLKPDGSIWSAEYSFINPLDMLDALHYQESHLLKLENTDRIIKVKKAVLNAEKLEKAPPLFRIKHWNGAVLIRDDLKLTLEQNHFTNCLFDEVPVKA